MISEITSSIKYFLGLLTFKHFRILNSGTRTDFLRDAIFGTTHITAWLAQHRLILVTTPSSWWPAWHQSQQGLGGIFLPGHTCWGELLKDAGPCKSRPLLLSDSAAGVGGLLSLSPPAVLLLCLSINRWVGHFRAILLFPLPLSFHEMGTNYICCKIGDPPHHQFSSLEGSVFFFKKKFYCFGRQRGTQ